MRYSSQYDKSQETLNRAEFHEIMIEMIVKLFTCTQFGAVVTTTKSVDRDEIFLTVKLHKSVLPMTAEFYNYNTEMQPVTPELANAVYTASGAGFYSSPEMQQTGAVDVQGLSTIEENARTLLEDSKILVENL